MGSSKTDDPNLYCERRLAKVPHPSSKMNDLLVGPAWKLRLACKLELCPQNKKEPLKQQRTNSILLSDFQGANEIHLAFVFFLVLSPCIQLMGGSPTHPACKPTDLNLL